jgi:iron complex outermembrane recepter protein
VASTKPYTLLDLSVGGQLVVGASALELHVTADNVLNTSFRDYLDSQKGFTLGQGRNVGIRLSVPLVIKR